MNWPAVLRRYVPWRAVVVFGALLFAIAAIPTRTAQVVSHDGCTTSNGAIFGRRTACPIYKETYHGGVWTWSASVATRPAGTTTDPSAYRSVSSVRTGFHVLPLAGEVLLSLVVAVALTVLVSVLRFRSTRTPPYGAVRRRRQFRLSRRRF